MAEEPMTLADRLQNPQWVHSPGAEKPELDVEQTVADMKSAAELLSMKLPCEVWVEPGTMLKKGASFESLMLALMARS